MRSPSDEVSRVKVKIFCFLSPPPPQRLFCPPLAFVRFLISLAEQESTELKKIEGRREGEKKKSVKKFRGRKILRGADDVREAAVIILNLLKLDLIWSETFRTACRQPHMIALICKWYM